MTLVFTPFLCIKKLAGKKHTSQLNLTKQELLTTPIPPPKNANFSQVSTGSTRIARHSLANSFQFPAIFQGVFNSTKPKGFPTHQIQGSPVANPSVSPVSPGSCARSSFWRSIFKVSLFKARIAPFDKPLSWNRRFFQEGYVEDIIFFGRVWT